MSKEAFGVGGGSTDTVANVIHLTAFPSADGNYMTFETPEGDDYTVPSGRTLVITRLLLSVTVANFGVQVGHGTDGVGDGAPAPANLKLLTKTFKIETANVSTPHNVAIPIPADKLPFVKAVGCGCLVEASCVLK